MSKVDRSVRLTADELRSQFWLRCLLVPLTLVSALTGGLIWFLPVDVIQDWAYQLAPPDDTRRLEAISHAEFLCWLLRVVMPLLLLAACRGWYDFANTATWLSDAVAGMLAVTRGTADGVRGGRWRTVLVRVVLAAWCGLAVVHFADSLRHCVRDWPYYRFRSGDRVLPNISDSNVDVIRYVQQATPTDARILVVSDQKLFFLSYYLLPRRLYHKMHPDSEHVIPKENLQRRLATYRLKDLDAAFLQRIAPDYILEYFEHPDEFDRSELQDDPAWIAFQRRMHGNPSHVPKFLVRLRRVTAGGQP